MIVKIFAKKGGGSAKASIDYLRGKDKEREGARVIKGDPDLSQKIAESLEFKNNYTVGCLSFEERNIPEEHKKEIIEKFEKTIFAGLEEDQYNISWIEHTDKDRLELNFFIPNVELKTQKRLQPYYDKADRPLVDNFKKVTNYEYGLSNPDLDEKKQLVKTDLTTPRPVKKLKEDITELFSEKISKGVITSRDQLKEELEKAGFTVTRETKNSISIENPDPEAKRNIRLDGEIYKEEFYEEIRSVAESQSEFERYGTNVGERTTTRKGNCEGISEEDHSRNYRNLQSGIEQRTERNKKLYPKEDFLDYHNDEFDFNRSIDNRRTTRVFDDSRERDKKIEPSESNNERVTTIYSVGESKDDRRQRVERNISLQRERQERILRSQASERLKNNKIKEFFENVSERIKDITKRTREGSARIKEFFRDIKGGNDQVESTIKEIDRSEKSRVVEREERAQAIRSFNRKLENSYGEIGEREREIREFELAIESRESTFESRKSELNKLVKEVTKENVSVKEQFKEIIQQRLQEKTNNPIKQSESVRQKESAWEMDR